MSLSGILVGVFRPHLQTLTCAFVDYRGFIANSPMEVGTGRLSSSALVLGETDLEANLQGIRGRQETTNNEVKLQVRGRLALLNERNAPTVMVTHKSRPH